MTKGASADSTARSRPVMRTLLKNSHDLFSSGIYLPLSRMMRLARRGRRDVMLMCRQGMQFRQNARSWNPEQKRLWVLDRLRFSLRRAYRKTEYYKEMFDRIGFDPADDFGFEEFARIPVLEREQIRSAASRLVSSAVPKDLLRRDSSGGSTGEPAAIWVGPEEKGWRESATETFMRRVGAASGSRTAFLWGHHLDPVKSDRFRDRLYSFMTNVRWFDCFRLSPDVLEQYHDRFSSWQPACIVAYASALGQLAEHILEYGHKPNYPTHCLVTGGEKLLARHRSAIEAAFGRPVHERYGARDTGPMGFQVQPRRSLDYEVDWANLLVEPEADEEYSPVLVTKLHGDGMPMIRYRVGDLARF